MTERGRPMLAGAPLAQHILDNVAARSRPFGTKIVEDNGVGRVVLSEATRTGASMSRGRN